MEAGLVPLEHRSSTCFATLGKSHSLFGSQCSNLTMGLGSPASAPVSHLDGKTFSRSSGGPVHRHSGLQNSSIFFPLKLFLQGLGTSRDEEDGHHASGYEIQLHKSWGCLSACPQRYLQWEKPSLTRRLGANSKPQSTQVTEVTGT